MRTFVAPARTDVICGRVLFFPPESTDTQSCQTECGIFSIMTLLLYTEKRK